MWLKPTQHLSNYRRLKRDGNAKVVQSPINYYRRALADGNNKKVKGFSPIIGKKLF